MRKYIATITIPTLIISIKLVNILKYLNIFHYSFDEIVAHHEIFTGSEATDFGEHLTLHQMKRFEEEL